MKSFNWNVYLSYLIVSTIVSTGAAILANGKNVLWLLLYFVVVFSFGTLYGMFGVMRGTKARLEEALKEFNKSDDKDER